MERRSPIARADVHIDAGADKRLRCRRIAAFTRLDQPQIGGASKRRE